MASVNLTEKEVESLIDILVYKLVAIRGDFNYNLYEANNKDEVFTCFQEYINLQNILTKLITERDKNNEN